MCRVAASLQQIATVDCGSYTNLTKLSFGVHRYATSATIKNLCSTISTVRVPVSDDARIEQQNSSARPCGNGTLWLEGVLLGRNYKCPYYRLDLEHAGFPHCATIVSDVAHWYVIKFEHTAA